MLLGCARVSTAEQQLEPQLDALIAGGVEPGRIYTDKTSGAKSERPGLDEKRSAFICAAWRKQSTRLCRGAG